MAVECGVLQCYNVIEACYNVQCYCITVLQFHRVRVLQCYSVLVFHCFTVSLLQCFSVQCFTVRVECGLLQPFTCLVTPLGQSLADNNGDRHHSK